MTAIKELMDWIQTFRKSLNKTLTELKVEEKIIDKRYNKNNYENEELMIKDMDRLVEIPKKILIIEGKIAGLNETEDNFKKLAKKDLEYYGNNFELSFPDFHEDLEEAIKTEVK